MMNTGRLIANILSRILYIFRIDTGYLILDTYEAFNSIDTVLTCPMSDMLVWLDSARPYYL
jgi:hypothetical protein